MLSARERLEYAVAQGTRVAWYMGHYFASQRYRQPTPDKDASRARPRRPGPGLARVLEGIGEIFARDLSNIESGLYPLPREHDPNPIAASRRYFADLPAAAKRKAEGRGTEVYSPEMAKALPAYFLQNFHYQTGGYLTEESAKLYDTQVEVLFSGTTNAMRRQCLVPIASFMRGRDQRKTALLDVACGTGRFIRFVRQAYPRLRITATDLSEAYLAEARRHVRPYGGISFEVARAEALPFPDQSFDIVTSIYLFHEVPPTVRREIAREFRRVLKPGGLLVFMDSLQLGDVPDFDGMLENFPSNFHEPYYASYIREDLRQLFGEAGLAVTAAEPAFLSKLVVAQRAVSDIGNGAAERGNAEPGGQGETSGEADNARGITIAPQAPGAERDIGKTEQDHQDFQLKDGVARKCHGLGGEQGETGANQHQQQDAGDRPQPRNDS
jgi:ubiquinone/menaquinone biosynthesis C-methylase UbiE